MTITIFFTPTCRIPKLDNAICTGRGESAAIRGPGYSSYRVGMFACIKDVVSRDHIPNLYSFVVAARGDDLVVRRPCYRIDNRRVTQIGEDMPSIGRVPN